LEPWKTAITDVGKDTVRIAGYDIVDLMASRTFTDTIFLLHRGRLPSVAERRLLDAALVAVADHGPSAPCAAASRMVATANRVAPEAAVAAGVLAIGDAHGGAGLACMKVIADGLELAKREGISIEEAATRTVRDFRERRDRLPGIGHRRHSTDPRAQKLFALARESGVAGEGTAFILAVEKAAAELIKPMPVNIDGALAGVLHDLGFPPVFGKLVFIIGRIAGLTAHVTEEYLREKAMRIHVPVAYEGPPPRSLPDESNSDRT